MIQLQDAIAGGRTIPAPRELDVHQGAWAARAAAMPASAT